jgi:hypothetical protein
MAAKMDWPTTKLAVNPPTLDELAPAVLTGLKENFQDVTVSVESPPDLRTKPFYLAAPGLCGNTRIADVGGPEYVDPLPDMSKKYDFLSVAKSMGMSSDQGFMIGAGAGPLHVLETNTEYMPNLSYRGLVGERANELENLSRYAKINAKGEVVVEPIKNEVTAFALLINVFASDGLPGPLLHIKVKSRKGKQNFPEAIQKGLKDAFGDRLISIGGAFLLTNGKANLHAMAHSIDQPFVGKIDHPWLRSFDAGSPLVGLTVFHSGDDKGLNLRKEHTHCFSIDGDGLGGHYHWDIEETRDEVEYEAWLNTAEFVYRIDQPKP